MLAFRTRVLGISVNWMGENDKTGKARCANLTWGLKIMKSGKYLKIHVNKGGTSALLLYLAPVWMTHLHARRTSQETLFFSFYPKVFSMTLSNLKSLEIYLWYSSFQYKMNSRCTKKGNKSTVKQINNFTWREMSRRVSKKFNLHKYKPKNVNPISKV